jgi:hypothetical protein
MSEEETYSINDTMRAIRKIAKNLRSWSEQSDLADGRHVAMVLTKLEEAELLSQRIVKEIK